MKPVLTLVLLLLAAGTAAAQDAAIDWEGARADAAGAQADAIAWPVNRPREVLDEVALPVLLPALPEPVLSRRGGQPGVLFFARPAQYTASFVLGPATLELTGMASARRAHSAAAGVPDITRTEAGQDANFSRYGAGYTLSISCADPDADPRCTDPDFARHIVDHLAVAGGSGLRP